MDKNEALKILQFNLKLSLELLQELHELASTEGMEKAKEAEAFSAIIMTDQMFIHTGLEDEQFQEVMTKLKSEGLEQDP